MDDIDLTLATTDALADELMKRFDAAVFYGEMNRTGTRDAQTITWRGEEHKCIGMAYFLAAVMSQELAKQMRPMNNDEV